MSVRKKKKSKQRVCSKIKRVDSEPNRAEPTGQTDGGGGDAHAWGDTDLAWCRSSPFHKSGVPLGAQTHLRGSTI